MGITYLTPEFDIFGNAPHKVRAETTRKRRPALTLAMVVALADEAVTHVYRTFKFRLLPRKGQHKRLRAALDHTRDLYNAALSERIECYRKTGKGRTWPDQCRALTELRSDPAWASYPVTLQRWPLKQVDLAFQAFFRRVKARDGKVGFPRFKGREWFKTFGFSDTHGWKLDGPRLYMKGIGRVKVHLHRAMPSRPVSCQIKREAKGWAVLLVCEVPVEVLPATGRSIGLDLGITAFVATSDGGTIPGFRAARRAQAEMRRRQRALARCKRGSANRTKAKTRVSALHEKAARARRTFMHQVAAKLVRENDLIAIENLNVKGLAASALARDVSDAGWSTFTNLLAEKAEKAARSIVKVDPRNTSQTCSGCGAIVPKALSVRTHDCPHCGLVLDRDVNAARNVLHRAGNGPGTGNVAGCGKRSSRNICEAA